MIEMAEGEAIQGVEMVSISKDDLAKVLAEWESEARTGGWVQNLTLDVIAQGRESTEYLWPKLVAVSERIEG